MAGGSLNASIVFLGYGAARGLALQTTRSAFGFPVAPQVPRATDPPAAGSGKFMPSPQLLVRGDSSRF
jgi:hypothetical protein